MPDAMALRMAQEAEDVRQHEMAIALAKSPAVAILRQSPEALELMKTPEAKAVREAPEGVTPVAELCVADGATSLPTGLTVRGIWSVIFIGIEIELKRMELCLQSLECIA